MPTFLSPPKLLNGDEELANGTIVTTATNLFLGSKGLVTPAAGHGIIVDGEILNKDETGPYVFPVTPPGTALKIALILDSWRDGRIVPFVIERTVSVPNQATVTWDQMVDVVPVSAGGSYIIPPWVLAIQGIPAEVEALAGQARDAADQAQEILDTFAGSEIVQDAATAAVSDALSDAGVVTGAAVVDDVPQTAWAHTTDSVNGVVKRLPLGYTADGHLDAFARKMWMLDVDQAYEGPTHPEFASVRITESNHILWAQRWDGSVLIPGLPDADVDPVQEEPTQFYVPSKATLVSPFSTFDVYHRGDELLPVLPDMKTIAGIGSSSMARFNGEFSTMATSLGSTYRNFAIGGILARHQAAITGAIPAELDAFTLPADTTPVLVNLLNVPTNHAAISIPGVIRGRAVTLSKAANYDTPWYITPATAGPVVNVPSGTKLIPNAAAFRAAVWIFNSTKNDLTGNVRHAEPLEEAIKTADAIYDFISPLVKRVVVLSQYHDTNTPAESVYRDNVNALNAHQKARYGFSWVDSASYITSEQIWADTGILPNDEDRAQQALGNKPPSLSTDELHLSDIAEAAIMTNVVKPFLTSTTGWYTA